MTVGLDAVFVQFEITPKAFANFSPGLERQRQPWDPDNKTNNPERVRLEDKPFQGCSLSFHHTQGSRKLEPRAEISKRLRRIFELNSTRSRKCHLLLYTEHIL